MYKYESHAKKTVKVDSWANFKNLGDFWYYNGAPYVYSTLFYDNKSKTNLGGTYCKSASTFSNWVVSTAKYTDAEYTDYPPPALYKPGYYPQFTGSITIRTRGDVWSCSRSENAFIIKDSSGKVQWELKSSDFKDKTVPSVMYIVLQGGGGGGAAGGSGFHRTHNGSGGGGGGCLIGLMSIPSYFSIYTGNGGYGGYNWQDNDINGGKGGDTILQASEENSLVAYGGAGGKFNGPGGAGGGTWINSKKPFSWWTLGRKSGGSGGTQDDGGNADTSTAKGVSGGYFSHSCFRDDLYGELYLPAQSAGNWGGRYSAPGGASQYGKGGYCLSGGKGNCSGGSGTNGSGGGGGRYWFPSIDAVDTIGGKGGDGFITMYLGYKVLIK